MSYLTMITWADNINRYSMIADRVPADDAEVQEQVGVFRVSTTLAFHAYATKLPEAKSLELRFPQSVKRFHEQVNAGEVPAGPAALTDVSLEAEVGKAKSALQLIEAGLVNPA